MSWCRSNSASSMCNAPASILDRSGTLETSSLSDSAAVQRVAEELVARVSSGGIWRSSRAAYRARRSAGADLVAHGGQKGALWRRWRPSAWCLQRWTAPAPAGGAPSVHRHPDVERLGRCWKLERVRVGRRLWHAAGVELHGDAPAVGTQRVALETSRCLAIWSALGRHGAVGQAQAVVTKMPSQCGFMRTMFAPHQRDADAGVVGMASPSTRTRSSSVSRRCTP